MAKSELLRGRGNEAVFMLETTHDIVPQSHKNTEPVARDPLRIEQWRIVYDSLSPTRPDVKEFLRESPKGSEVSDGTNGRWLLEYTTAKLARETAELEIVWHRQGKIHFAIPGIGEELVGMAIERNLCQTDALFGYYRQEAEDLARGGTVKEIFEQVIPRDPDNSGGSRILAGHPGMDWRSNVHTASAVGTQALPGVGVGLGIELRRYLGLNEPFRNFSDPNAISVIHVGDATMAEGETKEAVDEMALRKAPVVLVVHNNGSGISTNLADGSVGRDPIAFARGLAEKGLTVLDADATNIPELYKTSEKAVKTAREKRTGVVLHVKNIYKRMHSSSDDPSRYSPPEILKEHEKLDPIPLFRKYLIDRKIAAPEELDRIDEAVHKKVLASGDATLVKPEPDRKFDLYRGVYAPKFFFGRKDFREYLPEAIGEEDVLGSTYEHGVEYLSEYRTDTQAINMRQAITMTLMQEMARDKNIIVFGEDVADFSSDTWKSLPNFLEQRLSERSNEFTPYRAERMMTALPMLARGDGHAIDPETFADLAELLGGKGGVFKNTQFLQLAFGPDRVRNSRLAEASIVGTAVGYALSGFTPVVELQFDAYWSPAYQQINDQLATLRWRSNGQFSAGMVIRIQGMNRLGGVGGIGHGEVITGKLDIPGIRYVMPAHADETGPLLRESIRVARDHGEPVIFLEPINLLNNSMGHFQGENTHIPLGVAEIRRKGSDLTVLTWSNNLQVVEEAAKSWEKELISPTIINMRTLGVATDWQTVAPEIYRTGKIMVVESERSQGSAGSNLVAMISKHFFNYLDAPIVHLAARNFRTPAGTLNEAFALPQTEDVVREGIKLARY